MKHNYSKIQATHLLERPATTNDNTKYGLTLRGQDIDIFESDDEDNQPGPGAYYNPQNQTSFKTGKKPERLQFFGSTVERFGENQQKSNNGTQSNFAPGPGSYHVQNLMNYHKKQKFPQTQQGFISKEQRFQDIHNKGLTPGPGQYQAPSIASEVKQKMSNANKGGGGFGSSQNRFVANSN